MKNPRELPGRNLHTKVLSARNGLLTGEKKFATEFELCFCEGFLKVE